MHNYRLVITTNLLLILLLTFSLAACSGSPTLTLPDTPLVEETTAIPAGEPTNEPASEPTSEPVEESDKASADASQPAESATETPPEEPTALPQEPTATATPNSTAPEAVAASETVEESETVAEQPPADAVAAISQSFVKREGSGLTLDGQPYRFMGTNAFFLQPDMVYGRGDSVAETLDKAVDTGFNVVRLWGFNDEELSVDPASIQTGPARYNEGSLMALDRVIALAKERNLRLIMPLVNNWEAYGGVPRYVEWCDCGAQHGDFFTNETIKALYRDYVSMLLTRINTETGIAYRDEPTILAWELGNELRNRGASPEALLQWHREMAAFIKILDPNHLIADGGEGFDSDASLYPGLSNTYPVRGAEGTSYSQIAAIPEIDMVSYHLYPEHWQLEPINDGPIWIRTHEAIATQLGKVAYMGEFGITLPDAARANMYRNWLHTALTESQSSGALVWNLVYDARANADGFSIYCPADIETCQVLDEADTLLR